MPIGGPHSLNFIAILSHTARAPRARCTWEDIMQGTHKFALVLAAGFILGASAIQALHAQAKPPGYLLAEVAVTVDEATYKDSEFMKQTVPSINRPAQNTSLVVSITPRHCQALRPPIASFFCNSSRLTKPRPGTLTVRPSAKRN
jgi:hypothetical protein